MLSYLFQLRVILGSLTTEKEMKRTEMPLCPRAGSGEWELWLHGANCPPHLVRLFFGALTKPAIHFRGVNEGFPLLPYGLLVHWLRVSGILESWNMLVTVLSLALTTFLYQSVQLRAERGGRLLFRGCVHKAQALGLLSCLESKVGRLGSVVSLKSILKQCIQGAVAECKTRLQTSCSICDQSWGHCIYL